MRTRRPTNVFTRRRQKLVSASFRLGVEALESRTVLSATHLIAHAMFSEPFPDASPRAPFLADPAPGPVRLGAPPMQDSPRGASEADGRHGPGVVFGMTDAPLPGGRSAATSSPERGSASATGWVLVVVLPPPAPLAARTPETDESLVLVSLPASTLPALDPGPPAAARGSDLPALPPARPWETNPAPLDDLRPRGDGPARPPVLAELESLTAEESALQFSPRRAADEWNARELFSPPFSAWKASGEDLLSAPSLTPHESPDASVGGLAGPTGRDAFSEADWDIYQDSDDEGGVIELGDLASAMRRSLLPPALRRDSTAAETSEEAEDDELSARRQLHASPREEDFDESRLQDLLDPQLDEDRYDQGRSAAGRTDAPGACTGAGGHEEGGTIELAVAAYSTAAWAPAEVPLADDRGLRTDSTRGGGVDGIPMDAGLGLFQAFELAVGPGERIGQPVAVPLDQLAPGGAPATAAAAAQVGAESARAAVGSGPLEVPANRALAVPFVLVVLARLDSPARKRVPAVMPGASKSGERTR